MKILFLPPTNAWSAETGYAKQWGEFIGSLPTDDKEFSLANGFSDADFVISQDVEVPNGPIKDVLRPLSRKDIMTFVWDISDRPSNRYSGFYCSLPKHMFDHRRHSAVHYPIAFNKLIDKFPYSDAEMDFSFLGAMSHTLRIRLIEALRHIKYKGVPMAQATDHSVWEFTDAAYSRRSGAQAEFADLLQRSKFVLCPRGYGTGSMRMFEVMQAGRVPVIISDSYVLPSGIDWNTCAIIIPENRIGDINTIIQANIENWEKMAENARETWENNFSPAATLSFFGNRLIKMSQSIASISIQPWHHSAQMAETLFLEHARPIASKVKQSLRRMINSG